MGKIKKILCMLLVFTVIIAPCSLLGSVFAQTGNSVPLTVEVTTDKSSYTAYGIAEITVNVTNTSDETINNISAEAVFNDLSPVGKNNETSKEIESLKSGESFSFSYKATVNANKVKLNFFEKIILWFVRLFNGGYSATGNNFDDNREYISKTNVIDFGNASANNEIKVWYEKNNTTSADYQELISGVDIDEMYDYDESDISVDEENGIEYINNIIIIMFDDDCTDTEKAEAINSINGKVVGGREMTDTLYIKIESKTINELYEICDELSEKYKLDAFIDSAVYVDSSPISYIPNDPHNFENETETSLFWENYNIKNTAYRNWYHLAIQSVEAWKYNKYFESINIGIVDSGFLTSHEDLNIEIISKNNSVDNHGTHVAGIIGAKANNSIGGTGIVWNKNLYGYSIGTSGIDNRFFRTEIFSGLETLVKNRCKVINFSLGYSGFLSNSNRVFINKTINMWGEEASKEIAKLLKKYDDFIIIQSAGNGAKDDIGVDTIQNGLFCSITKDNCYYNDNVSIDEIMNRVITVAAATINNGNYQLTEFSNGGTAEISAPGHFIYNAVGGIEDSQNLIVNGQKYACLRGTSMAAPIVAGVAGLVWSVNPNFSGEEVKEIVCSSYDKNILVKDNPSSPTTGDFRLVNAKLAVEEAIKRTYGGVGIVTGTVKDETTGNTISGVNVEVIDNSISSFDPVITTTTDENGQFSINLPYGDYSISFNHEDYENELIGQLVDCDYVVLLDDILLTPKDSSGDNDEENGNVFANITDCNTNMPIANVNIEVIDISTGETVQTTTTDENGEFVLKLEIGKYSIVISHEEYQEFDIIELECFDPKEIITIDSIKMTPIKSSGGGSSAPEFEELDSGTCGANGANVRWTLFENGEIVFSGTGDMVSYYKSSFLPTDIIENILYATVENGVSSIGANTFKDCINLKGIILPESITSIGDSSFYNCTSLESIDIPYSVTIIGESAFYGCSNIETVTIPNGVSVIEISTFEKCYNLSKVNLSDGLLTIKMKAFNECLALSTLEIPNSVVSIGERAFGSCTELKEVTWPCSTESSYNTFYGSDNIEKVTITEGNGIMPDYIGNDYYSSQRPWQSENCKSVIISNGVKTIGDYAFVQCKGLKNIIIPESVESIGENAFRFSDINSVIIPSSLTAMGDYAFYGCNDLTSVYFSDNSCIGVYAFMYCNNLTDVVISSNVTEISTGAFEYCTSLTNVSISDSVTKIGDYAFYHCDNLKTITIPKGVTTIGQYTFGGCDNLTNATILGNATVCDNAFYECVNLTNVSIKGSNVSIGNYVFYNCISLKSISIPNGVTNIGDEAFSRCESLENMTIIGIDAIIGSGAFYECIGLKNVTITGDVTSIGDRAFYNCEKLESISIPNTVTSIGEDAFACCSSLTNIKIPNKITSIKSGTFSNCEKLISITIPSSVTSIENAFSNCSGLKNVYFTGTKNQWNKISISDDFGNTWLTNATIHYNS